MPVLHLNIPAGQAQSYPIIIEEGLLSNSKLLNQHIPQKQICIVSNETIAPLYLDNLKSQLKDKEIISVILKDGEEFKNIDSIMVILDALLANQFHRDCVLIALGGGVVGDITGFAAASYQRGVKFVQIPTSLLAQVDSSVGGKTGVNHPLGKNMIGAFHQPQAVFIDTNTVKTLPDREFSAGLGEIIKYGLINDIEFFGWLEENAIAIMEKNPKILNQMIAYCCQNKANVVAADEKEQGSRALLNLGHTFGHALEMLTHYKYWKHGEAVAIGILMAANLSQQLNFLSGSDVARIQQLICKFNLPSESNNLDTDDIYNAMFLDKKVQSGELRLILMENMGHSYIATGISEDLIKKAINLS